MGYKISKLKVFSINKKVFQKNILKGSHIISNKLQLQANIYLSVISLKNLKIVKTLKINFYLHVLWESKFD